MRQIDPGGPQYGHASDPRPVSYDPKNNPDHRCIGPRLAAQVEKDKGQGNQKPWSEYGNIRGVSNIQVGVPGQAGDDCGDPIAGRGPAIHTSPPKPPAQVLASMDELFYVVDALEARTSALIHRLFQVLTSLPPAEAIQGGCAVDVSVGLAATINCSTSRLNGILRDVESALDRLQL